MRRTIPLVLTGFAIVLVAACGTVTEQSDGSGQGGTSGQAGSGAGGSAGTTGQAGSTAGTTGQGGTTTGQAGADAGGRGGNTGNAGRGGNTGNAGRGGNGGTTGNAGRGGSAGNAGNAGASGRGGVGGRGGQAGQTDGGIGCSELESEYSKAVQEARACTPDGAGQCQQLVDTGLACPQCQVRVTDTSKPDAIRMQWNKADCTPPIFCPALICVVPGPGMCTRSDAGGSGGICTMQSGGIGPI